MIKNLIIRLAEQDQVFIKENLSNIKSTCDEAQVILELRRTDIIILKKALESFSSNRIYIKDKIEEIDEYIKYFLKSEYNISYKEVNNALKNFDDIRKFTLLSLEDKYLIEIPREDEALLKDKVLLAELVCILINKKSKE